MAVIFEFKNLVIRGDSETTPPVSLSIEAGEKVAMVFSRDAHNWSFLSFILCLGSACEGFAAFKGKEYASLTDKDINEIRRNTGTVSKRLPMISNQKLIENIYLPVLYEKNSGEKEIFQEAYALLQDFGMEKKYNTLPAFLSTHEMMLAFFARTWLRNPDVVYYSDLISDTEKASRTFLVRKIEEFHNKKPGRISIVAERSFDEIDAVKIINFDKIVKV